MILPIDAALGEQETQKLPSLVREHLAPQSNVIYNGTMVRVWRRGGWQGILAWILLTGSSITMNAMMADVGKDIPFQLANEIKPFQGALKALHWSRTFFFPQKTRHFNSYMTYETRRSVLCEWMGESRLFGFALNVKPRKQGILITSKHGVLRLGSIWIPLHAVLVGSIRLHVGIHHENTLRMSMTLHHPLLGDFYGYEGFFSKNLHIDDRN